MGSLGVFELVLIFGAVLLIFGPSKLPQLGDAIGKSIRNFRKASGGTDGEIDVTPRRENLPPASEKLATDKPAATTEQSSQKA